MDDRKLREYYAKCRAFVFPQEEDFGISAVEAMSAGRPVIAYRGGGALEIIEEGETGIFFDEQSVTSLIEALRKFRTQNFDARLIREHARQFDKEIFKNKIKMFAENALRENHNS